MPTDIRFTGQNNRSAMVNSANKTDATPFAVKNAAFTLLKSLDETIRCCHSNNIKKTTAPKI